jgi:5-methylcytosine-specific restriction endonuclease McrA
MLKIDKDSFVKICLESQSMAQAAITLGLHFNTFKKYAMKYNCYITNQPGKGIKKKYLPRIASIEQYATRASVRRLILKNNLIEYKCFFCGIDEWNNKKISLHLDHIDGNRHNHVLHNLRWLCPNCHSQTETYTGKNKK